MTMFLFTLACVQPGPWDESAVLAPHFARPDTNHDGHVDRDEYARVAWAAPDFDVVDRDQDGGLDHSELRQLVSSQSPTTFDGALVELPSTPGMPAEGALSTRQRHTWEVIVAIVDEVRRVNGPASSPTDVLAAVNSGALDSPESLRVLAPLRDTFAEHRWHWPFPEVQ